MTVEIAPGRFCQIDFPKPPTHILCKLVRIDDRGTMRAIPVEWTPVVPLRRTQLNKLGIHIPVRTLRRLIKAGLVKGSLLTPKQSVMDLLSLHQHVERTRCDHEEPSEFWTTERRNAYVNAHEPMGRHEEDEE